MTIIFSIGVFSTFISIFSIGLLKQTSCVAFPEVISIFGPGFTVIIPVIPNGETSPLSTIGFPHPPTEVIV